jgi:hypothetical protein
MALAQWSAAGKPNGVIEVLDNGVYGGNIDLELPAGGRLVIQAVNGKRPNVRQVGNMTFAGPEGSTLVLNGFLMEGAVVLSGDLDLEMKHCTLVPGMRLNEDGSPVFPDRDSIVTTGADTDNPGVSLEWCIVGSIRLPEEARGLTARDCIIDACTVDGVPQPAITYDDAGNLPGPPTTLERVTVLGGVYARQLDLASAVLFTDVTRVVRRQVGCVRFSFLPAGSLTPRRFQCQADLALSAYAAELGLASVTDLTQQNIDLVYARLKPRFTSEHYGDPGYGQLSQVCAAEIRTGAEDGSEMGAFEHLKQPQREANLRASLDEYLPFGLEAGVIFVS